MIQTIEEAGLSELIYYVFHVLGFVTVFFFALWYGHKFHFSKKQIIFLVLFCYPILYLWIYILSWAETGFTKFGGNNIVRGFVWLPVIGLLASKILKQKWSKICAFLAPMPCLSQGVSHIGCIFAGCCHGYQSSWGIYQPYLSYTVFPVQLFEAATALIITVGLTLIYLRYKDNSIAVLYPIMLITFGFTRFGWEFARDNEKIFLGCSVLAFHALFMAVVGVIWIIVLIVHNRNKHGHNQLDVT